MITLSRNLGILLVAMVFVVLGTASNIKPANALTTWVELEPNNSLGTANNIAIHDGSIDIYGNVIVDSGIGTPTDFFSFQGTAADNISVESFDLGQQAGFTFNSVLYLYDPSGNLEAMDDDGGAGLASLINFLLDETGTWTAGIGPFNTTDKFQYRVEVRGLTAVPIPAALPLFLTALVAMGLVGRRKRSAVDAAA
jgi:hypothetical protein